MSEFLLRPAADGDLAHVARLWQVSFRDPAPLVHRMLTEGGLLRHALVAETDGRAASVMFAFPDLSLCGRSAAYLYALCTLPACRGRGLGRAVAEGVAQACFDHGADLVFLSPADAALSRWYQDVLGMAPLCAAEDLPVTPGDAVPGTCTAIAPETYAGLRRAAPGVTTPLLRAQGILLEAEGGGFFRLDLPQGPALACAVPEKDGLLVLELLCPAPARDAALRTLAVRFGTGRLRLRGPGKAGLPLLCRSREGAPPTAAPETCFPFIMD